MKKIILITLITTQYLFALITITPVEIGEQAKLSGKLEAGFDTKRGNTDKDDYKASFRLTYDDNTSFVLWGELSGEYGKSNGAEYTNKMFSHLRYIHSLTGDDNLKYELFAQLESDDFKEINTRLLSGAGLRYKIFNTNSRGKGFFGLGGFYEGITYKSQQTNPSEDNTRLNSYLAYTIDFSNKSIFSCSLYYQPKLNDFKDYVQYSAMELRLNVYKELFLKFSMTWNVDSRPPLGVKKSDFTQTTTFVFDF